MGLSNYELKEKVYALLRVGDFSDALHFINIRLNRDIHDNEIEEFYNLKAKCLMNLERYDDALYFFIKSWLKNDLYVNHRIFDKVFAEVYGKKIKKAFWFFLYRDYEKNNNSQRASRYHRFILKNNRGINIDEVLLFVDNYNLKLNSNSSDTKKENTIVPKENFSKYMGLADDCISKKDYKQAIFYLNKLSNYEPALVKKADLLINEVLKDDCGIYEDYFEFWKNISYLSQACAINDEALLIKGFYLLEKGYYDGAINCYDSFLKDHKNDKRAIFGKICALNEMGEFDYAEENSHLFTPIQWAYIKSEMLMVEDDFTFVIKVLNKVLKYDKKNVGAILRKAIAFYIDLKFEKALSELDGVLKIDSNNMDAIILKGEILAGLHKYDDAIKTFNKLPSESLPVGYEKLIEYLKEFGENNAGFFGTFKFESHWEYVYVESDIFKRLKSDYLDDLKIEVLKRGLIWKGVNKSLQMKSTTQNKINRALSTELLYDFDGRG